MFLDPEASQENLKRPEKAPKRHPKRHPKVVQNLVKKWSKSKPNNEQKKPKRCLKKNRSDRGLPGRFWGHGASKNAYFEDVFKMAKKLLKMPKNGPKMIPKWFKIAQIA